MTERLQPLTFIPFTPAYRKAFFDRNKAWLEAYFLLEPFDIQVLSDPETMVLQPGGEVHFGLLDGEAIATFALTPRAKGTLELNKMAVKESHRSRGYGHQMMEYLIGLCRERGVHTLELYSHTSLASAIHLYRKFGFEVIPLPDDCVYDRADIRMKLAL